MAPKKKIPVFQQCPGCAFNFLTGEGNRSCGWYDCPYLPEEMKMNCPVCNFNFYTREGEHYCKDMHECQWAREGFKHAGELRRAHIG